MTAGAERRVEDARRLDALCAASGGRLRVLHREGTPPVLITLELQCRTVGSHEYPARAEKRSSVRVSFPGKYPFEPPIAEVLTPIFHPNVFSGGRICFGNKWLPSEGLDLLIRRIGQILTFDPVLLNESSPANPAALQWYRAARARRPDAFPTDYLPFLAGEAQPPAVRWRNVTDASAPSPAIRIVRCRCTQQLRVQGAPGIRVRCPRCRAEFAA